MRKPSLFIGSSSEQLPLARLLRQRLVSDAEVSVWDEGIFNTGNSTLIDLLAAIQSYDFAVFVFAADDLKTIREKQEYAVRDNVIFELGLFMGHLGKERTAWVVPKGSTAVHIPSDLFGINSPQFDTGMRNADAAAGHVADKIRTMIQQQGLRSDNRVAEVEQPRVLCVSSEQRSRSGFDQDVEVLTSVFGKDVHVAAAAKAEQLYALLAEQNWDIVHLVGYVDQETGDLYFSDVDPRTKAPLEPVSKIRAAGLAKMIEIANVKLTVLATCNALALAAQLARVTNVVSAASEINCSLLIDWSRYFYDLLARGRTLSQAFDVAKAATDASLVLVSQKEFRVRLAGARA